MHISNLILAASALFAGLSIAVTLPAPTNVSPAIQACKDKGIDPYGPIPNDYTEKTNGTYYFKGGSKAATWVQAQFDLPPQDGGHNKRQGFANIGIGMFAQDWCQGEGAWADDVQYGVQNVGANIFYFSVGISYRGLRSNEQLDFSRGSGSDLCGLYLYSAGQNTPVGCFNSQAIQCFRLTLH